MWKALVKLVEKWACHHEWEQWKTVNVNHDIFGTYAYFHFYCKKCGKFKRVISRKL